MVGDGALVGVASTVGEGSAVGGKAVGACVAGLHPASKIRRIVKTSKYRGGGIVISTIYRQMR